MMPGTRIWILNQLKVYVKLLNGKQLAKDCISLLQKIPEVFSIENKVTHPFTRDNIRIYASKSNDSESKNSAPKKPMKIEEPKTSLEVQNEKPANITAVENKETSVYNLPLLEGLKQRLSQSQGSGYNEDKKGKSTELLTKWKSSSTASVAGMIARTKHLLVLIDSAESVQSRVKRLEDFIEHLRQHPEAKQVAVKEKAIRKLLRIRDRYEDYALQRILREALAILGHIEPLPHKGIRILSIDGGGIRGIAVIWMLKKLEELTGKKIYQLFDYICGVSTGSILVACIGTPQCVDLDEALNMYKEFGTKLFTQSTFWGVSNLVWSRAYYDTTMFEDMLKKFVGETLLIRTNRDPGCPKLASISTVMNRKCVTPFIFRNYELPQNRQSQYLGSCNYSFFESVRASGAAPTVFQEFSLDGMIHQDGGILVNNPCAVAIHEAKLLWPNSEIQCVVSCGTGRHTPSSFNATSGESESSQSVSWKILFNKILDSATDTEGVHRMLNDLLPPHVYFRFNPYLTETVAMHEIRPGKICQLEEDTNMYVRKNEEKFGDAAKTLLIQRTMTQKIQDYIDQKSYKYGLKDITSKL